MTRPPAPRKALSLEPQLPADPNKTMCSHCSHGAAGAAGFGCGSGTPQCRTSRAEPPCAGLWAACTEREHIRLGTPNTDRRTHPERGWGLGLCSWTGVGGTSTRLTSGSGASASVTAVPIFTQSPQALTDRKSCTSFSVLGISLPEFIPHYSKRQNMMMPNNNNINWHCRAGGHSHTSKCLALHTQDTQ